MTHETSRSSLLSDDFDEDTLAPAPVKLSVENLFPRAEVRFAFGDGNNYFAPHDLPFHVRIGVILAGAVVPVLRYRLMRREFFKPHIIVMQQPVFGIIYEYRRRYMHGIHQTDALLNTALSHQAFDRIRYVHESTAVRNFKPKMFCQRFHGFDILSLAIPFNHAD